jgi:transcriptional regulator GlxA family with amidase domain
MHKVGFIVFPAFSPINFAATSVFETANWQIGKPEYQLTLLSEEGGPIATSLGSQIQTVSFKRRAFDTIIVAGGIEPPTATPGLVKYLQSAMHRSPWRSPKTGHLWSPENRPL